MNAKIQISPNNRASCQHCRKKIKKGTKRMRVGYNSSWGFTCAYICQECIKKMIDNFMDRGEI